MSVNLIFPCPKTVCRHALFSFLGQELRGQVPLLRALVLLLGRLPLREEGEVGDEVGPALRLRVVLLGAE
eukprot:102388-Hanusia_phi.AAC.1